MIKKCGNGSVKVELPKDFSIMNKCLSYINKQKSNYLWIDAHDCKKPTNLDFLQDLELPQLITNIDLCGNFMVTDAVYRLKCLNELSYYPTNDSKIDLINFPMLRIISTNYAQGLKNLNKTNVVVYSQHDNKKFKPDTILNLQKLKDLRLHGPKDFSFLQIVSLTELEVAFITQCNIKSFLGIANMTNLKLICMSYCRSLKNIEGVSQLTKLEKVWLDSCPKLTDISELSQIKNLKTLILENLKNCDLKFLTDMQCFKSLECLVLRNCGDIPTIKFLDKFENLQAFDCLYSNIIDGDLAPCMRLESVRVSNKRHYNIKEKDLPFNHVFMHWWQD